jgi:hypothetical protein
LPGTIESEVRKTNGKIERLQETLQGRMNLLFYTSPGRTAAHHAAVHRLQPSLLSRGHRQRHSSGCVRGRREEIWVRRAEQKRPTMERRLRYNLGRSNKLRRELKSKV